jgi:two-component system, cell cycle sensor histidine kinase and response regulator CckA
VKPLLRVLMVEDEEADVLLLVRELERAGHPVGHRRVDSAATLRDALGNGDWDVILSDYAMHGFDGSEALRIVRSSGRDIPFVVVSGFIGEEQAARLMKAGASDFLVKDRLFRLAPVVEREVAEARIRREQARALEQKQREFLQAQKMEAVGRLAGGVAHDFNNLLSVILGFAHTLARRLPADPRLHHPTGEIILAAERAAQLTRQLLRFCRKEVPEPRVVDLNAVVRGGLAMLRRLLGETIELEERLMPGVVPVRADPGQLEQVILNLAVNARDAMPGGGRLVVETAPADIGDVPALRLSVSDTGSGITAEVRPHLFEPFFTTKEAGKGTGLGLATVHAIVTEAGGLVDVESSPGRGSSFHVRLPRVAAGIPPPLGAPHRDAALRVTETVLVVEDDSSVRELLGDVLSEAGYKVVAAGSSAQAQRVAAAHEGPLHLLLCDVVLPDGSGSALLGSLLERHPGLRALFLSGYTDDEIARAGLPPGAPLVRKPIAGDELLGRLRQVVEA